MSKRFSIYLLYKNGQDFLGNTLSFIFLKKYLMNYLEFDLITLSCDTRKDVQIKNYLILGHSCRKLTWRYCGHSPCYEVSVRPDQFFVEMLRPYVASDSCFPFRVCVFVHIVGPNLFDHKKDDRFVRITLFTVILAAVSHSEFLEFKLYALH